MVCSGERPEEVQAFPHGESGGFTCLYKKGILTLIQSVVNPVPNEMTADMSFAFVVKPFISEQDVAGRDEIGRKSLRTRDALGFATSSRVVIVTETNGNKTCRPEEILPLGRLLEK